MDKRELFNLREARIGRASCLSLLLIALLGMLCQAVSIVTVASGGEELAALQEVPVLTGPGCSVRFTEITSEEAAPPALYGIVGPRIELDRIEGAEAVYEVPPYIFPEQEEPILFYANIDKQWSGEVIGNCPMEARVFHPMIRR